MVGGLVATQPAARALAAQLPVRGADEIGGGRPVVAAGRGGLHRADVEELGGRGRGVVSRGPAVGAEQLLRVPSASRAAGDEERAREGQQRDRGGRGRPRRDDGRLRRAAVMSAITGRGGRNVRRDGGRRGRGRRTSSAGSRRRRWRRREEVAGRPVRRRRVGGEVRRRRRRRRRRRGPLDGEQWLVQHPPGHTATDIAGRRRGRRRETAAQQQRGEG